MSWYKFFRSRLRSICLSASIYLYKQTLSALPVLCEGNLPTTGWMSFTKGQWCGASMYNLMLVWKAVEQAGQTDCRWFETWRLCDVTVMTPAQPWNISELSCTFASLSSDVHTNPQLPTIKWNYWNFILSLRSYVSITPGSHKDLFWLVKFSRCKSAFTWISVQCTKTV